LTKQWSIIGGLLLATMVGAAMIITGNEPHAAWTASVVVLCATWWVFEPIPIPVTSLIPLAVFPLVGVLDANEIGESYGSPLVLLMMGGFMLSVAMERSNTHRRIALSMVNLFGGRGGRPLVFGFMAASAVLSMWISNAATTLMLLPIVMAIVRKTEDKALQTSLLLGVAYAASIGGIATPIGTPPNLVFMAEFTRITGSEPTFTQWMTWAFPIAMVMLPSAGFWLTRNVRTKEQIDLPQVGDWRSEEIRTLAVFAVTAILWMSRKEPFGGWSTWLGLENANDASVALLAAVAMHLLPSGNDDGSKLLDWKAASSIPWGILILYGGGIAIAKAFGVSGLSQTIGASLMSLSVLPVLLIVAMICLAVTFLTEVTSNTATATLLMPILAAAALAADIDPKLVMVPATISCSFAFMLPVATPPNAIVFGSEQLTIKEMVREGLILNLLGVVIVTAVCLFLFG
jgi:solute carrier family 13 (sodium-dependent dicarboxylate transporter), member 2/3/5